MIANAKMKSATMTSKDSCLVSPPPRPQSRGVVSLLCGVFFLSLIFGCGTGEYERRLADRVHRNQQESKFNNLYAPQELPKTPVSVRMPTMFKDSPLVEGAQVGGKPVDPRRVKPGLFELPWLKLTYEGFIDDPNTGKLPYYCYLGAVNMAGGQVRDPAGAILAELKNKQQFDIQEWAPFSGETPEGRGNQWKKLRFTAPQEFFTINKARQEQFQNLPGVLEVYLHDEAGYYVLIAWRMPGSIEQQVELAKWAPLVAGSVSIKK